MDRANRTSLHYESKRNNAEGVRELVNGGADPNAKDSNGWTPLHFAAQEHAVATARELIRLGSDVNARDKFEKPPLSVAVYAAGEADQMVTLLLDSGADPYLENNYGVSPIRLARTIADTDVRQYFDHLG
ncbi:ankyrin repeat domain-containing protein [Herbiconiux sp. CPCC 205763]|uniref:Ankyrin repeat domain-containing protein n=1 Tax=Herbiconiux aconitum TaxID=2970913 RepID=A0ABT2GN70_9MICO|nr:ankyrin repeat domain-containing protein [Herbiconiux aconitum]MCS5717671.1 ankyrin repeat domain-containing protein [Herbiconiux aconitum]